MWKNRIKRVADSINYVVTVVCYCLLIAIVVITVFQVFLRFILNSPTSWSEEISLLMLVWFGLLAVAVGVRRHDHVAITFFRDLLAPPLARSLDVFAQIAMGGFMFVLLWYGPDLLGLVGVQRLPASSLPKSILYLPTLIGGFLGMMNAVVNILLLDIDFKVTSGLEDSPHG